MSRKSRHFTILICILILSLCAFRASGGEPFHVLEGNGLTIHYGPSLRKAAQEVMEIYPAVESELWELFDWRPEPRPLILITEGKAPYFGFDWEKTPISAFALPSRHLAVLHWGRVGRDPLRLHDVLKHELCHILLHQRIMVSLPRWLDEGICQWASDGISELLADPAPSRLNQAVSAGNLIPLRRLERAFPVGENDLILSYEESKGFVVYLVNRFGKSGLMRVLNLAAEGDTVRDGFLRVTAETPDTLERDWHTSLKGGFLWVVKISHYLYEILFVVMALLAVWGFMRQVLKKRAYRDDARQDESGRDAHLQAP
jgi:Peptidase MA superfamily